MALKVRALASQSPSVLRSAAYEHFFLPDLGPFQRNSPGFGHGQRQRKEVEALFAELKNQIGLRRLRLRRLRFVRDQFFLAGGVVAEQNVYPPPPSVRT